MQSPAKKRNFCELNCLVLLSLSMNKLLDKTNFFSKTDVMSRNWWLVDRVFFLSNRRIQQWPKLPLLLTEEDPSGTTSIILIFNYGKSSIFTDGNTSLAITSSAVISPLTLIWVSGLKHVMSHLEHIDMGISPLYCSLSPANFQRLVLMFLYNSTFHILTNDSQHVVHSSSIESQHNVLVVCTGICLKNSFCPLTLHNNKVNQLFHNHK